MSLRGSPQSQSDSQATPRGATPPVPPSEKVRLRRPRVIVRLRQKV